jgi:hypothetical protein
MAIFLVTVTLRRFAWQFYYNTYKAKHGEAIHFARALSRTKRTLLPRFVAQESHAAMSEKI